MYEILFLAIMSDSWNSYVWKFAPPVWALNFKSEVRSELWGCLDAIAASKPHFLCWSLMQGNHFPFPACREKGMALYISKVNDSKECRRPRRLQIGLFWAHKTHSWEIYFHFINKLDAAIPFSCMQRKKDIAEISSHYAKGCQLLFIAIFYYYFTPQCKVLT